MRPLAYLPNTDGFRFLGLDKHGDGVLCVVIKNPEGIHRVHKEDTRDPCWHILQGWIPHKET